MTANVVELSNYASARGSAFVVSPEEMDALFGVGPLAFLLYVHLRSWMDFRTGIVGVSRALSLEMLATYATTEVPRGKGTQMLRPTVKQIRVALEGLKRVDLIRRRESDLLIFSMPMARTGNVRSFQTGQGEGASQGTGQPNNDGGLRANEESTEGQYGAHNSSRMVLLSTKATANQDRSSVDVGDNSDVAVMNKLTSQNASPFRQGGAYDVINDLLVHHRIRDIEESVIDGWVKRGLRGADVCTAIVKAKALRLKKQSNASIPLNLLVSILKDVKPDKPKQKASAETPHWRTNAATINRKGRELNMDIQLDHNTKRMETIEQYARRIAERLGET